MIKYLYLLCFIIPSLSFAQQYQPENIKPKALALYDKALVALNEDDFETARKILHQTIIADSNYIDAYLSLAGVYGQQKNYANAVKYYSNAIQKDTVYGKPYYLPLSINLAGLGQFKHALDAITIFLLSNDLSPVSKNSGLYRKSTYEFALDYQLQQSISDYTFNPINLGDSINTMDAEYYPSLSIDDSLIIFNRRKSAGGEYFYQSKINSKKQFLQSEKVKGDLNDEPLKGAISLSADGEWMIFAANFSNKSYGNFDLYISYNTPEGWSEPENLGPNINSKYWESAPSLSPDKRALYFSSNRPNGYGGADIYVSYRNNKGVWGKAINMGENINTLGDEQSPFIHSDNQTFYFTSTGLKGYGGSDLFVVRKDSLGVWGNPINLGYPINTIENEGCLIVNATGETAYYASDRSDSRGRTDLYKFELRKDIKPLKTLYIKGFVFDKQTSKGIPCSVELIDNTTGKKWMDVQTEEDGFYFITLPTTRDFTFSVSRQGYFFYNKLYPLSNKNADSTYKENIYLIPITTNTAITLNNIQFNNNSFVLKEQSMVELNTLVQLLSINKNINITIQGHTDNIGKKEDNDRLSTQRAKTVMDFLVNNGIDPKRLLYKGFGSTKPIADNATEQGRAMNRRTEFIVTDML